MTSTRESTSPWRATQPPGGTISQIGLFYLEGAVSSLVLLLVLVTGARIAYAAAFLVTSARSGRRSCTGAWT